MDARSREIGFWTAVALVLGNMIGSGVFLLPASLAPFGGIGLIGWVVSALGSVLLALAFARLARLDPASGGPYAYTRRAFGDLAGFVVAWGYWISTWCTNAALAIAFVASLSPFMPSLVHSHEYAAFLAIATLWLLTGVNILGVRAAGRVQVVTTTIKILPLVLVGIGGLIFFESAHFAVTEENVSLFAQNPMTPLTLTLWAFLGLECATIPAAAVRDPDRTIPRATIIGTLLAAGMYMLSTAGVMSLVKPEILAMSAAPFADAARIMAGDGAAALVALGAAVSCFGALNGWILVVGQLPLAVANDGLFPRAFARRSASGTPALGMLLAAVLSTILIAMNYSEGLVKLFERVILLATLSALVPYAFCSLAALLTRPLAAASTRPMVIASLAFLYSAVAIYGAGRDVIYFGFWLLLAGLPIYVWVLRHRADP